MLDVGCFDGRFADLVRRLGHHVTGLDVAKHDGVADRVDAFVEADLNQPLPDSLEDSYDLVVAGDILEHVVEPQELLAGLVSRVAPGGQLLVSVPNFGHWYPRGRIAAGRFDYDQRGPLDRGHVRFFTRATIERLFASCDLRIIEQRTVGTPFDTIIGDPGKGARHRLLSAAGRTDEVMTKVWPGMFAYQLLYRLEVR